MADEWKSANGLSEEEFRKQTLYANAGDNTTDNRKRAEILGFMADDVCIAPGAIVRIPPENCAENVFIGLYCYVNGDVTLERNVLVGPHCSLPAGNHKFDPATGSFSARDNTDRDVSIVIGEGSWLSSGVTVTAGVRVGRANLICANSVVTRNTPDYAIMAGTPATQIGRIDPESGEYIWGETE